MIQTCDIVSILFSTFNKDISSYSWYRPLQRLMALESYASHILDIYLYGKEFFHMKSYDEEIWLDIIKRDQDYPSLIGKIKKYRRSFFSDCILAYYILRDVHPILGSGRLCIGIGNYSPILISGDTVYTKHGIEIDIIERKSMRRIFEEAYLLDSHIPPEIDTSRINSPDIVEYALANREYMGICQVEMLRRIWDQMEKCIPHIPIFEGNSIGFEDVSIIW